MEEWIDITVSILKPAAAAARFIHTHHTTLIQYIFSIFLGSIIELFTQRQNDKYMIINFANKSSLIVVMNYCFSVLNKIQLKIVIVNTSCAIL